MEAVKAISDHVALLDAAAPTDSGFSQFAGLAPLRAVIDSIGRPGVLLDREGRVLHANAEAEQLFGRAVAAGWQRFLRYYGAAARRAILREVLPAVTRRGAWQGTLSLASEDGPVQPVHHRINALPGRNAAPAGYFVLVDYDPRRTRIEAELCRARDEAERANRAKTRFLAAASHDLRQPLQALGLFVEVLAGRGPDEGGIVARIRDSVAALDGLLNSLLDVSKLEAGLVTPRIEATPLAPLVERLGREFAPLASKQGLKLRWFAPDAMVRTDPLLLERIIRNLVKNALRYTRDGGVLLGCRRRGGSVSIEVWDTGIGIPASHLHLIFQEFHQLGNPQRDRRQGLGLGLAIVQRLARLLDHRVTVDSRPERGSVFRVEVPLAGAATPQRPAEQLSLNMGRRGCLVALIDDEGDVLESARLLLESWGHQVVGALDAGEALRRLRSEGRVPDVIVADYRLANGLTGGQAIRRIRDWAGRDIPAIIVTGDTAPDRLRQAHARGFRLLHKPVQPASLREAIESVTARR